MVSPQRRKYVELDESEAQEVADLINESFGPDHFPYLPQDWDRKNPRIEPDRAKAIATGNLFGYVKGWVKPLPVADGPDGTVPGRKQVNVAQIVEPSAEEDPPGKEAAEVRMRQSNLTSQKRARLDALLKKAIPARGTQSSPATVRRT